MDRVAQFVRDDGLHFIFRQQFENAACQHDAGVVFRVTVGKGVRCAVVDVTDFRIFHLMFTAYLFDEFAKVFGHLRAEFRLVEPALRQVRQEGRDQKLEQQKDRGNDQGDDQIDADQIENDQQNQDQQAVKQSQGRGRNAEQDLFHASNLFHAGMGLFQPCINV